MKCVEVVPQECSPSVASCDCSHPPCFRDFHPPAPLIGHRFTTGALRSLVLDSRGAELVLNGASHYSGTQILKRLTQLQVSCVSVSVSVSVFLSLSPSPSPSPSPSLPLVFLSLSVSLSSHDSVIPHAVAFVDRARAGAGARVSFCALHSCGCDASGYDASSRAVCVTVCTSLGGDRRVGR